MVYALKFNYRWNQSILIKKKKSFTYPPALLSFLEKISYFWSNWWEPNNTLTKPPSDRHTLGNFLYILSCFDLQYWVNKQLIFEADTPFPSDLV